MASLSNKNGLRTIQFKSLDGTKRPSIRLGRIDGKTARTICTYVEDILTSRASGHPMPQKTAEWLGSIGVKLHEKLAASGLIEPREHKPTLLGDYLKSYVSKRTDLKQRTRTNLNQTEMKLVEFFGAKRDLRTINVGEAGDWRRKIAENLSVATVATHVKKARQFFADAMDRRLITENPFGKLEVGSQSNDDRLFYVPALDIEKVIASCPDAEWRLVFALARYGGLRTPSESRLLRWSDVKWDAGRIIVRSSKTERYKGKEQREIPLFPELLPYLLDAYEKSPGSEFVLAKLRGENLRTTADKIVKRAGLEIWPRLFQNLRASRETDLTAFYPLHVACAWIGNTETIARRHYLKVTDDHFATASGKSAVKSAAVSAGQDRTFSEPKRENPAISEVPRPPVPPRGIELPENPREILMISRDALQKALHRLEIAMPHIRAAEIAHLERNIAAARAGRFN